jgi:hypothetical protein
MPEALDDEAAQAVADAWARMKSGWAANLADAADAADAAEEATWD